MRRVLIILITLSAAELLLERRPVFFITGLLSLAMLLYRYAWR